MNLKDEKSVYKIFTIVGIVATLLRLFLAANMNHLIIVGSEYDDWLQMRQASSILSGNWLGEYNRWILCKNVSFPLFLAGIRMMNISYGLAYGILVCTASRIFTIAIRPIFNRCCTEIIYILLVFCPVGFGSLAVMRVYRNALVPWIILIIISCEIGFFLRANNGYKQLSIWAVLYFVVLPFFWMLREDSVWIIPLILFSAIATAVVQICLGNIKKGAVLILLMFILPLSGVFITNGILSEINYRHYGVKIITDRTDGAVAEVNKLLYQVDDGNENGDPDIWVSREALVLAAKSSPTLNSLDGLVEMYESWGQDYDWPHGDMVTWALRECAAQNGLFNDAKETQIFFQKIANELHNAFEEGMLTKKRKLFTGVIGGGIDYADVVESFGITMKALPHFASFYNCDLCKDVSYIDGTEKDVAFTEMVVGRAFSRSEEQLLEMNADSSLEDINECVYDNQRRIAYINSFCVSLYSGIASIIRWIAALTYFILIFMIMKGYKNGRIYLLFATGMLLAAFTNLFSVVISMRWYTRDVLRNTFPFYSSATYILMLLFMIFSIYGCISGLGIFEKIEEAGD